MIDAMGDAILVYPLRYAVKGACRGCVGREPKCPVLGFSGAASSLTVRGLSNLVRTE